MELRGQFRKTNDVAPTDVVTGYEGPDLDAVSCAIGYAQLMRSEGKNAVAVAFGEPHREAQFVLNRLDVTLTRASEVDSYDRVRLVDASDLRGISDEIAPESVVEVIDHREDYDPDAFRNATYQVETVGAAATLVVERFKEANRQPSDETATLLYAAIVSNTLDLEANVTTDRDRDAIAWLQRVADVSAELAVEMFEHKSEIDLDDLYAVFDSDFAEISEANADVGIVQIEILDVREFISNDRSAIETALDSLRDHYGLDYLLLMGVDLSGKRDVFFTTDTELKRCLERVFGSQFDGDSMVTDEPVLRKELVPDLRDELSRRG